MSAFAVAAGFELPHQEACLIGPTAIVRRNAWMRFEAASLGGVPSSVTTTRMRGDITGGLCGMWSCNDTRPYRKSNSDIMLVQASEERFCSGAPNGRDSRRRLYQLRTPDALPHRRAA